WGPGWVEWGEYDDYYGWAPLGSGINININIGMGRARSPWDRWVFLPRGCMADGRRYNDYAIRDRRGLNIYNNITIINKVRTDRNSRYYEGPDRRDVERYSRTNIATRHINALDRPGRTEVRNNNINIYRPNVTSRSGDYNRDGRVDNRDRIGASIDRNNNNNRVERADRSNSPVDRNINTDRSARQNQNAERNIVPQQSQAQDNNAAERSDRNWGNRNITPQQQQQPAPQPQVQANAEQRNSRAGRWGGNSDRNIVPQQQQQPAPQPQVQANAEQRNNSRAGRWGGNERSVAPQQQQQPAPQPQVQANAEQLNNSRAGRWGGNERSVAPQAQPQQQVQPQQRQEVMQQRESRRFEQPQRQQVPAVSPPQNNGKVEKSNDDNRGNGNGWGRRGKN
ncbi:MAG: hypothetical protein JWN76_3282, partial [Chitinophagaceae bacterium]|nr:hypothetical protein [Chitinophagaceae bacterium]